MPRDRKCRVGDLPFDRPTGMQRDDRERCEQLGRCCDRDDRRARALAQERRQQSERAAERLRPVGVEQQRLASLEQCQQLSPRQLLRPREQRTRSCVDVLVVHVHGPCDQFDPALVGHPDHSRVDPEQGHDRLREHIQRRLERETLRERARDLELRIQPLRSLPLRAECLLELPAERRRPLVQARVLHGDRQLCGERDEQRSLVGAQRAWLARIDGEQADGLVADYERQCQRCVDPRLAHRARAEPSRASNDASSTSTTPPAWRDARAMANNTAATASCGPSTP